MTRSAHRPHAEYRPPVLYRSTVVALLAAVGLASAAELGAAQSYESAMVVVLDVSGSMKEQVEGGVKRDLAQRGLLRTLNGLPAGTAVALRLLGVGPGGDECGASRLAVPFAPFEPSRWRQSMESIRWDGATPLVLSMRQGLEDLRAVEAQRKEMLIIGDGAETCGEDPVGVARDEAQGIRIHTISLGERVSHQLAGIALVTGGTYTRAFDEASFETATTEALPTNLDALTAAPAGEGGGTQLQVILDVSNSMWGQIDGRVKMELAREALAAALVDVPPTVPVGLRAYGHRVAYDDREAGCLDTELLIAPQPGSVQQILARSAALQPRGQTPLALSLRAAASDLDEAAGGVVLLISDGIESCGGDPVAVAAELRSDGTPITIHAVGLGVDTQAADALSMLAGAGGGDYFDAPSAEQLFRGIGSAVRATTDFILAGATSSSFPSPIERRRGGDSVETAEEITAGTYSFTEHLYHEERYFAVHGTPGEQLVLAGLVCALAIGRSGDGDTTFLGSPSMMLAQRIDAVGERLRGRSLTVRGDMGDWREMEMTVQEDGWARFRIGRALGNVHRDMVFRVERR
ncbi:MAG TPA: VWA domain-containing protein [Acidobacteriota bacterium]|nr:VWA domain-containing protein [Acidobacteriota bacterium]